MWSNWKIGFLIIHGSKISKRIVCSVHSYNFVGIIGLLLNQFELQKNCSSLYYFKSMKILNLLFKENIFV
jgi:hypothetical protein